MYENSNSNLHLQGNKFKGDLLPDGRIRSQETNKIFGTPSAWAIYCKKIVNPDKKSGCGWASVSTSRWWCGTFLGIRLHYKSIGRWMPSDAFHYIWNSLCLTMFVPDSVNLHRCATKARNWTRTRTTGIAKRELNLREREKLWVSDVYGYDGNGSWWTGAVLINVLCKSCSPILWEL